MKKTGFFAISFLVISTFLLVPVFALEAPVVTLERVDVASIQPFFVKPRIEFKNEKEPGKEIAAGSILNLAYIFNVKNPNKEALMLDEMTFTTLFEGFEVNTAFYYEDAWIPGGKTNQVRVVVTNETLPTIGSLSVGAGNVEKLKEMKVSAGAIVKKWWETIGDFSFPVEVVGGTALFKTEKGDEIRSVFVGKFERKN
ncbi:MAG: hypothetical protein PHS86_01035 [Syntrophaceae bacterium]|nr:hypothetical protein [Syntrophaceae bacterium]